MLQSCCSCCIGDMAYVKKPTDAEVTLQHLYHLGPYQLYPGMIQHLLFRCAGVPGVTWHGNSVTRCCCHVQTCLAGINGDCCCACGASVMGHLCRSERLCLILVPLSSVSVTACLPVETHMLLDSKCTGPSQLSDASRVIRCTMPSWASSSLHLTAIACRALLWLSAQNSFSEKRQIVYPISAKITCLVVSGGKEEAEAAYEEGLNAIFSLQLEHHCHMQPYLSSSDGTAKWAKIEMWPMTVPSIPGPAFSCCPTCHVHHLPSRPGVVPGWYQGVGFLCFMTILYCPNSTVVAK